MKYLCAYLTAIFLFNLGGCDFLNYNESTYFGEDDIFSDFGKTKNFLNNIYAQLPDGFNNVDGAMRATATDNAEEIDKDSEVQQFNDGSWSAQNTLDAQWGDLYGAIQATNKFLEKFDIKKYQDRQFNDDYPQIIEQARLFPSEARFLRAFFYFRLIKRYGHVALVTKSLTPKKANEVKPSSYEKITNFIVSECDAIIPKLPVGYHNIPSQETGRATRGAAMALKAKTLLYAASPLHSSSGDIGKWKKAAVAAKAVIDSSWYSLENNYSNVVNNRTSDELIFGRREEASNSFEADNFPIGFVGAQPNGTAPTQNLVDAYETQEAGLPIDNPGSGYDPQHPYRGRDPRLKKSIIVNNSSWKGRKVQIWRGGKDGLPKKGASETGYYLKKYVVEDVSFAAGHTTTSAHTWVFFRYGGVLLNYAEAMNEAYGPDAAAGMGMTARQAVNKIRARAHMPDFPAEVTKEMFRKRIHNERRVEMAFENQRFWDIRRWKIGSSTIEIKGMEITKDPDDSFTYEKEAIEHRIWDDKMYLYPIPQSELFINEALKQNTGW